MVFLTPKCIPIIVSCTPVYYVRLSTHIPEVKSVALTVQGQSKRSCLVQFDTLVQVPQYVSFPFKMCHSYSICVISIQYVSLPFNMCNSHSICVFTLNMCHSHSMCVIPIKYVSFPFNMCHSQSICVIPIQYV